jgi:hypothetical protein
MLLIGTKRMSGRCIASQIAMYGRPLPGKGFLAGRRTIWSGHVSGLLMRSLT